MYFYQPHMFHAWTATSTTALSHICQGRLNCQGSDRTLDLPTAHPSWKKFPVIIAIIITASLGVGTAGLGLLYTALSALHLNLLLY